jgi:hypothetical protein
VRPPVVRAEVPHAVAWLSTVDGEGAAGWVASLGATTVLTRVEARPDVV